jgi:3-isopropylmalate/(R)-2-methylmalate dehydratase small subunit
MKAFGGPVLFLDRSDLNTDEIIPARYLTEVIKERLKSHLFEELKIEGFDPGGDALHRARVIVARGNFGYGSAREHAPYALEVNGISLVIAQSYGSIFRQNMFNCGMMAIELQEDALDGLFAMKDQDIYCEVDLDRHLLHFKQGEKLLHTETFQLNEFDEALVRAGGLVEFADNRY